ncbi:MAG: LptF/LptG family permease, partial [Gammaproteobacteria bacterium]
MRILSGYLFRAIVGTTALVLLVLLALGGFIEMMSQLDDIGEGNFSLPRALFYVSLKLPRMAADMLPVSV